MPIIIQPISCPQCGIPFAFSYRFRKAAVSPLRAKLVLAAGSTAAVALLMLFFYVLGELILDMTAGLMLPRRERGLIFALAYVLSIPLAVVPLFLGWWYAASRPRKLAVTCPCGNWQGICHIREVAWALPLRPGTITDWIQSAFTRVTIAESPIGKRRERLEERRRQEARQIDEENGPNPIFDFGKDASNS